MSDRPEVHLRVLTADDAPWVVELDRAATTAYALDHGWDLSVLTNELDKDLWASDEQLAWAVIIDGEPGGFVLMTGLSSPDAVMDLRISPDRRGRGVGREVLRQLADHHFAADPDLNRIAGRTHEHNVPMQRAFNAAGFRMEARYRDTFRESGDGYAAEWGYALTRADWEDGRHRADDGGFDLHGLSLVVDEVIDGAPAHGLTVRFLQEGRRIIARYEGHELAEGELAGILVGDVLTYRFVHLVELRQDAREVVGGGRARLQRRGDGRIEAVDEWEADGGEQGHRLLIERRSLPADATLD